MIMAKRDRLESRRTKEIVGMLSRVRGCWHWKTRGTAFGVAGIPDIIAVARLRETWPFPIPVFLEVKRQSG